MVWIEICKVTSLLHAPESPPARVVWIEISLLLRGEELAGSPPARVVWIEMSYMYKVLRAASVATREGGVD